MHDYSSMHEEPCLGCARATRPSNPPPTGSSPARVDVGKLHRRHSRRVRVCRRCCRVPRLRGGVAHAGRVCAVETSALFVTRLADLEALTVALAALALPAVAPAHPRGVLRPCVAPECLVRADVVPAALALAVRRARHARGEAHAEALQAAGAVAAATGRLAALDAALRNVWTGASNLSPFARLGDFHDRTTVTLNQRQKRSCV